MYVLNRSLPLLFHSYLYMYVYVCFRTKKLFLGGLTLDTIADDVREALSPYGKLVDVQIMTDKHTNKPRGFGFAIFEDFDAVDKCCVKKHIRIRVSAFTVFLVLSAHDVLTAHPLL